MATPDWNWQTRAACRGEDLTLFFNAEGERPAERDVRERKAKSICDLCPARRACLEYAMETRSVGFWGGLNDDQRKSERRRRMRRAASAGIGVA